MPGSVSTGVSRSKTFDFPRYDNIKAETSPMSGTCTVLRNTLGAKQIENLCSVLVIGDIKMEVNVFKDERLFR